MNDDDQSLKLSASNEELVVFVVRIVCLGLLGYWSLILIRPFLTIIVWSIIIAVALYPVFDWLSAKLYGHRALAAVAITVFTFFVMLGPATWLALSLAETVRMLLAQLGEGSLAIPAPSEAVKAWPLIGEKALALPTDVVVYLPNNSYVPVDSDGYYDILFDPSGKLIRAAGNQGKVVLWVGDPNANATAGGDTLVAVYSRTGVITSQPVAPGADPYAFVENGATSGM